MGGRKTPKQKKNHKKKNQKKSVKMYLMEKIFWAIKKQCKKKTTISTSPSSWIKNSTKFKKKQISKKKKSTKLITKNKAKKKLIEDNNATYNSRCPHECKIKKTNQKN